MVVHRDLTSVARVRAVVDFSALEFLSLRDRYAEPRQHLVFGGRITARQFLTHSVANRCPLIGRQWGKAEVPVTITKRP